MTDAAAHDGSSPLSDDTPSKDDRNADPQHNEKEDSREWSKAEAEGVLEHIISPQDDADRIRLSGVVFRNLTVVGRGSGVSMQRTTGDLLFEPLRFLKALKSRGPTGVLGKPPRRTILSNIDGCIAPGEFLLVLGRPGAGCSTFLKAVGNQHSGYSDVQGTLTYGGYAYQTIAKYFSGEIVYNPEEELHFPTLTVEQTLNFALKNKPPKDTGEHQSSRKDAKARVLEALLQLFGIAHTRKTQVGDEYVRGVSGGERKRVSIAETLITKSSVAMWDNATKGLDSNTALDYLAAMRHITETTKISTAVCCYQASDAMYDLFDKVILLDQGKCLFFGPAQQAKQYFVDAGFECKDRWTTADFLISVTNERERAIRDGYEDKVPRTPGEFEDHYRKSSTYQANLKDIDELDRSLSETRSSPPDAEQSSDTPRQHTYDIPFYKQALACTVRQLQITWGDKGALFGKWGGILFQALIVGSLFYNITPAANGVLLRAGTLFFLVLFNAVLAMAEMDALFIARPIILKHKSYSFHRPGAYAIAQVAVDAMLLFVQALLFEVTIYFMANLARTASQWFISFFCVWLVAMTMSSFFRSIATMFAAYSSAIAIAGVALQLAIVYVGYLIPPSSMKPWFHWIVWVNPLSYGFEILMTNELYDREMPCEPPDLLPYGPSAQTGYQGCSLPNAGYNQTIINGSQYLSSAYSYSRSHLWRNFGILFGFLAFFVGLTIVGMEFRKFSGEGGSLAVFRRRKWSAISTHDSPEKVNDKESQAEKQTTQDSDRTSPEDDADEGADIRGLATQNRTFTFQNVNLEIPVKGGTRSLLEDVEGIVCPGRLTALMGVSGAGKTTLLNTLAQRMKTGKLSADFTVDGQPLPPTFLRKIGFAEQVDVHESTATVQEALRFSALLRQPSSVSQQEKYAHCDRVLETLHLSHLADAVIGTPGNGLSAEHRKLVTIAVELAAKPEILLFLDEPTSGLDSGAAQNVVRLLRRLADGGQAILCTIHQPSSILFEQFDDLILLASGGRCVYNAHLGHDASDMIEYFESNGADKCPPSGNPAEYALRIASQDPDHWSRKWAESDQRKRLQQTIKKSGESKDAHEGTAAPAGRDEGAYAMPFYVQATAVIKRSFISQWRNPDYVYGKLVLHILCAVFNGFTFWNAGYASIDYQNRIFSIFLVLAIAVPLFLQLQPIFLASRKVFQARENLTQMYSSTVWTLSAVLVEIPLAIVVGTCYFVAWWFPSLGQSQSSSSAAGYMWIAVITYEMYYTSYGQAFAAIAPNEQLASLLSTPFFLFVLSFCGTFVPYEAMPAFWRNWMYWIDPYHYLLEGMVGTAMHQLPVRCHESELARFSAPAGMSCEEYASASARMNGGYVTTFSPGQCGFCPYATGDQVAAASSFAYSRRWRDFGISLAFVSFNFMIVFVASHLRLNGIGGLRRLVTAGKKKTGA